MSYLTTRKGCLISLDTRSTYAAILRGVMVPPIRDITAQGYDLQFGTNVLGAIYCSYVSQLPQLIERSYFAGHFYFTKLLLPALLAGSKSSPDGWARVVNTSSAMAGLGKKINFKTLTDTPERKKKIAWQLYGQSKLVRDELE